MSKSKSKKLSKILENKMCRKVNVRFTSEENLTMGRSSDLLKIPGDNFEISSNKCCSSLSIFTFIDIVSS